MRLAQSLAAVGAACLALNAPPPASAEPFEHFTFHEEFDTTADCGDGLVLEFHDVLDGRALVVRHGDGFLYETRHWTNTAVTTIPGTDLTLTVVNKGLVNHDVQVTPNGDGSLTVKSLSPARVVLLGPDGHTELRFTGLTIIETLWDDAGTPDDQTDDEFLEFLSFTSHGHADSGNVCDVARGYLP